MRPSRGLHVVAKTENGPPFPVASEKQSRHDHPADREWNGFRRSRVPREKRRAPPGVPEILETLRGRTNRGNRLGPRAILKYEREQRRREMPFGNRVER